MVERTAVLSPCMNYRYSLGRRWDDRPGKAMFVLLNPSTADAEIDDATCRRGMAYASDWGYGSMVFCNIFAYRSTDPKALEAVLDPVGPENDNHILREASDADIIIAAWGTKGGLLGRDAYVKAMLDKARFQLYVLRLTKDGHPGHILYLPKGLTPVSWEA